MIQDSDIRNLLQQFCFHDTKSTDFTLQIFFFTPQHLQHVLFLTDIFTYLQPKKASVPL